MAFDAHRFLFCFLLSDISTVLFRNYPTFLLVFAFFLLFFSSCHWGMSLNLVFMSSRIRFRLGCYFLWINSFFCTSCIPCKGFEPELSSFFSWDSEIESVLIFPF